VLNAVSGRSRYIMWQLKIKFVTGTLFWCVYTCILRFKSVDATLISGACKIMGKRNGPILKLQLSLI